MCLYSFVPMNALLSYYQSLWPDESNDALEEMARIAFYDSAAYIEQLDEIFADLQSKDKAVN